MQFEKAKAFILPKLKKELPAHLSYHSVGHVEDVYKAATRLAKYEGIKGHELKLLLTAVLFHDSGFLVAPKEHEKTSCKFVNEYLPRYNYTPADIKQICGMIMATRIPQSPMTHMEQIICDADLDYLGRRDFFKIGNKLFAELEVYGIIRNELEWDMLQIHFLESHDYFTATAIRLRKAKKDEHLRILKEKVQALQAAEKKS